MILANLGLLITGFALLSRNFEQSGLPEVASGWLPGGRFGVTLLRLVFVVSSFLDVVANTLGLGSSRRSSTTSR